MNGYEEIRQQVEHDARETWEDEYPPDPECGSRGETLTGDEDACAACGEPQ